MGFITALRGLVSKERELGVGVRVQIISVEPGEETLLRKSGQIEMISDGVMCVIALDDGRTAVVKMPQLKSV
jgi:hypothetical protein